VVVTLLPRMLADIDLPVDRLEAASPIITGFLAGYVVAMPLLGAASDLRGRLPVYLGSLAVFGLGLAGLFVYLEVKHSPLALSKILPYTILDLKIATTLVRRPFSNGIPAPRSVVSEIAASSSARRSGGAAAVAMEARVASR